MKKYRVAIVGCGAVTRANLLPVIAGHDRLDVAGLVDRDRSRAEALASAYAIPAAVADLDELSGDVDGVVLATPPAHHAPATIALATRGKHVFVEKPMAITAADASAMVEAADRHGVALTVGLYRRVLPAVRLLRAMIEGGEYGRPLSIDAEEGGPYGWQLASLDVLTRAAGGGGVLIDIGSHVIDLLLSLVPGEARLEHYADNARGGIETDCEASFAIRAGARDIATRLALSRTRELRGSIRIVCERATLELPRGNFTQVLVHSREPVDVPGAPPIRITAEWADQAPYVGYQAFRAEIDDWIAAMDGRPSVLSGRSVVPVVRLIEACYQRRTSTVEPWTDEGIAPVVVSSRREASRKRRVLVTGAGGFLGGRTAEVLQQRHGWDVAALVREPKGAARLARWPLDIVLGDVCSPADMTRALEGCDAVVHCAVGTSWQPAESRRVTIEGTRTVAEAALRAGVKRFVHISTLFVHRRDRSGVLDETTPLEPPANDTYGHNKLAAEQALNQISARGLPTITLRPARIYGPFSKTFTVRPLQGLANGVFAISGDADVPANMVYVDNVVDAIARALDAPATFAGSAYLVSDPEQLLLREFYEFFARPIGATVQVVPDRGSQAAAATRPSLIGRFVRAGSTIAKSSELRGFVRRIFETDPIGTLPRYLWNLSPSVQQSLLRRFGADAAVIYRPPAPTSKDLLIYYGEPARVSSAKAQAELGFGGAVSQARAMELTLEWARYARLVPAEQAVAELSLC